MTGILLPADTQFSFEFLVRNTQYESEVFGFLGKNWVCFGFVVGLNWV